MEQVDNATKIKELAKQQTFGIKKAVPLGGSYAVVIPMTWLKWHGELLDGDYYFKMNVDGEVLVLAPINVSDLDAVELHLKEESVQ